jgi:hypothetical protein
MHKQLSFRVLLWAIENPTDELTAADLRTKFDMPGRFGDTHYRLQPLIDAGLLAVDGHGKANPRRYAAGPELRRRIMAGAALILDER